MHDNAYVETLATYFYNSRESLRGSEWDAQAEDAEKMRLAGIRWNELPDRISDAYRGMAEAILGPAIRA